MPRAAIGPYLVGCPWFVAYSGGVFEREPADFVERAGRLAASAPYNPPPPSWPPGPGRVRTWGPPADAGAG